MEKKPLFLTLSALSILLFAQICLAAPDKAVTVARDRIIILIDAGKYDSAEAAANKMASDFADNDLLARRLWEVANRYDKVEAYDRSKKLCEQIAANYPKDIYATYAGLQLAKLRVFEQIDAGNYGAAYSEVPQIRKDFAGHKQAARRLWEIANRYDKFKAYGYSKTLCEQIVANYPKDEYAGYAGLQLAKLKAYELIDIGDGEAAEAVITQMMSSYAKHKQLPRRLYEIAYYYEKKKEMEKAAALYNRIAGGWPNDEYSVRAFFYSRIMNADLDETKIAELQNEINNLAINNRLSTRALAKTMLNIAEMCHEKAVNSGVEENTANSLLYLSSELLEKYVVGKSIGSTLTAAYFILGLNCDKIGEYIKAAEAFKNAYQTNPHSKYAAHCLFAQADCYEKIETNQNDTANINDKIKEIYQKVITEYPESRWAVKAAVRLNWHKTE